ncbi:hypothetical protein [Photobacterium nomapromontoriensis]|uniref:hypothetical protein n=1 Tax=Photobacterium nomapromontoriensis TaxID=2910237 RepID=UPI003D1177C9
MMRINKITLSIMAVCIILSGQSLASGKYEYDDDSSSGSYHDSQSHSKQYPSSNHYPSKNYNRSSNGYTDDHFYSDKGRDGHNDGDKERLALNLVGTGYMYEDEVPDIDGDNYPDPAICFDVELKNIADGQLIGTATDCLSEITAQDGGLKLIGTTFFNLPNGLIVTRGLTTVHPVLQETTTPDGNSISHITGASSDESGVLKAYGEFRGYQGTARLSGMVDLSGFAGNVGDPMFFDCLFVIDLEKMQYKWPYQYNWYRHHHYQDDRYDGHRSSSGSRAGTSDSSRY